MVDISGISQKASITTSLDCVNSQDFESSLKSKVKEVMNQEAKASASGIAVMTANTSDTKNITRLTNVVKNDLNIEQLAKCIKEDYAKQTMNIKDLEIDCTGLSGKNAKLKLGNISQVITSKSVAKCMNEQESISQSIQELDKKVEQVATSKTEGLTMGALSSGSGSSLSCVIVIVIMIIMMQGGAEE
jgi:translation initiation factor 1 (eIF-1/SUI1)